MDCKNDLCFDKTLWNHNLLLIGLLTFSCGGEKIFNHETFWGWKFVFTFIRNSGYEKIPKKKWCHNLVALCTYIVSLVKSWYNKLQQSQDKCNRVENGLFAFYCFQIVFKLRTRLPFRPEFFRNSSKNPKSSNKLNCWWFAFGISFF